MRSPLPLRRTIARPDESGLVDFKLEIEPEDVKGHLSGFWGTGAAMADELTRFEVEIPHERIGECVAVIEDMHVEPTCRGRGYGRMLLNEFLRTATENRAWAVYLEVNPKDDFDLVSWYKRWDFVRLHPERDDLAPAMVRITATAQRQLLPNDSQP